MPDYKTFFADFGETTYLNCAYQGVFPLSAVARAHQAVELKCHPDRMDDQEYFALPQRVRSHIAAIIGSDEDEIALTNGATHGIGIMASGLDLNPGDEIIVASGNFPSNLFTWLHLRRRGVRVHILKKSAGASGVDDVARAFTSRTRVLALDWVDYSTGRRIDLAAFGELARHHGAWFIVDGTQGVGALELNVHALPVDVLAVAAYKWLLGPYGTGFVYVRKEVLDRLDLKVVNWLSVEGAEDFEALPRDDFSLPKAARIFDVPETANFLNLSALEASLEFVREAGPATVSRHCFGLLDYAADKLQSRGYRLSDNGRTQLPSTILSFRCNSDGATDRLFNELKARHIDVSLRHHQIRLSPYLYNDKEDIERLLEIAK
ncbi:MAG TPA: aminotransferase class V-fold PLP-dependent enzyme [Terriglobia bacterium]|nr:aminotransferase class V-fold PLP-dependent enzyme [Terriglobia bacterium]